MDDPVLAVGYPMDMDFYMDTPLKNEVEAAAQRGNLFVLEGALPLCSEEEVDRALYTAAKFGRTECVREILPWATPKGSEAACLVAARYAQIDAMRLLLTGDQEKEKVLHAATRGGAVDKLRARRCIVEVLLRAPHMKDKIRAAVFTAARAGDMDTFRDLAPMCNDAAVAVETLLRMSRGIPARMIEAVRMVELHGESAFLAALYSIRAGRVDCLRHVLANVPDDKVDHVLCAAIECGDRACVEAAMKRTPSAPSNLAMYTAIRKGDAEIVRLLDDGKGSAVMLACRYDEVALLQALVDRPLGSDNMDKAIITAAWRGSAACVRILLAAERPPSNNIMTKQSGMTPLMYAAARGLADMVELLVPMASLHVRCRSRGRTALDYAVMGRSTECVRLVMTETPFYGVDASANLALQMGYADMLEVLVPKCSPNGFVGLVDRCRDRAVVRDVLLAHGPVDRVDIGMRLRDAILCKDVGLFRLWMGVYPGPPPPIDGDCCVCLEPLGNTSVPLWPCCIHYLHFKCLYKLEVRECPLCREPLTERAGETPLSIAVGLRDVDMVDEALRHSSSLDINKPCWDGSTPLMIAAYDGRKAMIDKLLAVEGIDPNLRNAHDQTALQIATSMNRVTAVRTLVDAPGIDVDMREPACGKTVLMEAIEQDRKGIVEILVDRVDTEVRDNRNWTAFSYASRKRRTDVLDMLGRKRRKG